MLDNVFIFCALPVLRDPLVSIQDGDTFTILLHEEKKQKSIFSFEITHHKIKSSLE